MSVILLSIPFVATQHKGLLISAYNKYRVVFLDGGGEKCLRELEQTETVFKPLGNQGSTACPVKNAVRISKVQRYYLIFISYLKLSSCCCGYS